MRDITPTQITIAFTADEIRKVIVKMKPRKSRGCDEVPKYSSDINTEYADGIGKLTSNDNPTANFKDHITEVLQSRDPMISQDRTEKYQDNPLVEKL